MIIEQSFIDEVEGYVDPDEIPVFSDQAGLIGIRRIDTLVNVIAPGTPLQKVAQGQYRFEFNDPAPGLTYNYWIQFKLDDEYTWVEKNKSSTPVTGSIAEDSLSTPFDADTYFNSRLHSQGWMALSLADKQRALNDATRIIDSFEFIGRISSPNQRHQWPRNGIYEISGLATPFQILIAQYEMAYAMVVDGVDPEREIRGLRVSSRGYSSVRTTYDSRSVPEYTLLGVPSAAAWAYLSPFIRRDQTGTVRLHRVS